MTGGDPTLSLNLNGAAAQVAERIAKSAERLGVAVHKTTSGATVLDCGVKAPGGLEAGRLVAEACLAGLGRIAITAGDRSIWSGPWVTVSIDLPVAACLGSQYAGWRIAEGKFFAMASGPIRALAGKEELFTHIGCREQSNIAVGILEGSSLPSDEVCQRIAADCGVEPHRLTLLAARTASIAGTVQIAARSVETALHKMHELGFDVSTVASGFGAAPLSPVAKNDLAGIGRTNDSILYGAEVTLWLKADDESLAKIGPRIPSSASRDYGRPFGEVFAAYEHDFYKVDPHLFSPASITLASLTTGRVLRFGEPRPDLLRRSFEG
jgi:methenyltetrahydromethanopterin cyclohydrolase